MNVETAIALILLLVSAALAIPWLIRLSLSSGIVRKYSHRLLHRKVKLATAQNNLSHTQGSALKNNSDRESKSAEELKSSRALQVRYLSSGKSHSPLSLVPWDARGVLTETEKGFVFRGNDVAGVSVDIEFPSDEVQINYQKGNLLWDGGFSWCVIERDGEKHFFTSDVEGESAKTSLDSEPERMTATGIYQTITKRYI